MMRCALVLLGLMGLVAAGCGSTTKTVTVTRTVPATTAPPQASMSLRVYFLRGGRVQPVAREVAKTEAVGSASISQLLQGPTADERRLGLTSSMPNPDRWSVESNDGVVRLTMSGSTRPALAQVVYTLTQFPNVKAVEIDGKRYTRADFEGETPIIAVESPLPFQHVTSPLRATGTANTFEATFEYELTDPDGKIVATHFVTATSGSGQRGTFDFTVPFQVDREGLGELVVYERSAKDGSRVHVNEVPIYLAKS